MCVTGIFSAVPAARAVQQFISKTAGPQFFTYFVLFFIVSALVALFYYFIFRLKVTKVSQYVWLFLCGGLYVYFTIQLKSNPVETIHFLIYGLLSYFLFKALNHRIRDRTVYITVLLFVLLVGTADEFLQWIMPGRYWDYRDIGLNTLAGGIFLLAVWKGIRPKSIYGAVQKISVKTLIGIATVNLIFLGLCLVNTPDMVKRYTEIFKNLSWLKNEESMTEFGYLHSDAEIGIFYSRLTLEELRSIDLDNGKRYGNMLFQKKRSDPAFRVYTPYTNTFLFEYRLHLFRRNHHFNQFKQADDQNNKIRSGGIAFRENLIVKKYFGSTLKHSGFAWTDEKTTRLKKTASEWNSDYVSKAGINLITSFSLKQALWIIIIALIMVPAFGTLWHRRLKK